MCWKSAGGVSGVNSPIGGQYLKPVPLVGEGLSIGEVAHVSVS